MLERPIGVINSKESQCVANDLGLLISLRAGFPYDLLNIPLTDF